VGGVLCRTKYPRWHPLTLEGPTKLTMFFHQLHAAAGALIRAPALYVLARISGGRHVKEEECGAGLFRPQASEAE
jgi:hypothetical protein